MNVDTTAGQAASYRWFKGYPEARDERCTVLRVDAVAGRALVEWPSRVVAEGESFFPTAIPAGKTVRRPSGWVALDRVTFQ